MKRKIKTIIDILNQDIDAANNILPENFVIPEGNIVTVSIAVTTPVLPQYTRDGNNYTSVNRGVNQVAHAAYIYDLQISPGDSFNIRLNGQPAATIVHLKAELFLVS